MASERVKVYGILAEDVGHGMVPESRIELLLSQLEIAKRILAAEIAEDGVPSDEELKRELPNCLKKLGIPVDLGTDFVRGMLPRIVGQRLGAENVSITWNK